MENESLNNKVGSNQNPTITVQQEIYKKKNWIPIVVVISVLVLLSIVFHKSEFISFFIILSIPVVFIYLSSHSAYEEVSSYKMIRRSTFYTLLFVFDVLMYFIILYLLMTPAKGNDAGLAVLPFSVLIILGEIIFDILATITYELILKYKK